MGVDETTDLLTLTSYTRSPYRREQSRSYVVCFDGNSSRIIDLSPANDLIIGRSPSAGVHLLDKLVSREHALLATVGDQVYVRDLGSRHGTFVNSRRITRQQVLTSGDVVSLGSVNLVFHRDVPPTLRRPVLNEGQLRTCLEEELERALRFQRQVSLVLVGFAGEVPDRPRIIAALAGKLSLMDRTAFLPDGDLAVVLPESSDEDVNRIADDLCVTVQPMVAATHVGIASYPRDGCTADALLSCAHQVLAQSLAGRSKRRRAIHQTVTFGEHTVLIGDPVMQRVYHLLKRLAQSDLPVLISGETGTGKELAASAVHHWSSRSEGPLITVNCAALPETLAESEFFGHEKGAFTGARAARKGFFEAAHGGTLFLDELGELSLAIQAKLLRVLESGRVLRVGDVHERPVDVRIVAATNRDLQTEAEKGAFREDLYFRVGVAQVVLPPLRDRKRELSLLAAQLLENSCNRLGRSPLTLALDALERLHAYAWPGNIRELRNAMDYAAATAPVDETEVSAWHLPGKIQQIGETVIEDDQGTDTDETEPEPDEVRSLEFRPIGDELRELERTRMLQALAASDWVQTKAAALIAMPLRTFVNKLKKYQLNKPGDGA